METLRRIQDKFGRQIEYVRISITDKCNLRCTYCMPKDGVVFREEVELLTGLEVVRLCKILASLGIRYVRLTGGEPLLREDIAWMIKEIKKIEGIERVTLTTNGIFLKVQIGELVKAGLDGVNISLDTLSSEQFQTITRGGDLSQVLEGLEEALRYPKLNIKINTVLDAEKVGFEKVAIELVALAKDNPLHLRFLEQMPFFDQCSENQGMEEKVIQVLETQYGEMTPYQKKLGAGPGHYYQIEGFQGKIGFISAMSHPFCKTCNRIRITSTGKLRTCLQKAREVDLKDLLRKGSSDEVLITHIQKAIEEKPKEHRMLQENIQGKGMYQIGG